MPWTGLVWVAGANGCVAMLISASEGRRFGADYRSSLSPRFAQAKPIRLYATCRGRGAYWLGPAHETFVALEGERIVGTYYCAPTRAAAAAMSPIVVT